VPDLRRVGGAPVNLLTWISQNGEAAFGLTFAALVALMIVCGTLVNIARAVTRKR